MNGLLNCAFFGTRPKISLTFFVLRTMNVTKEIKKINEKELELALSGGSGGSWHDDYKGSPYIFAGNLSFELTEGDIVQVFSQYVFLLIVSFADRLLRRLCKLLVRMISDTFL